MSAPRQARVRALAKINLDLRVLGKRTDGFHEIRTIFQTVSLADTLEITFTPGRRTSIALMDRAEIADNLVARAAQLALDAMRVTGGVAMRLVKRIPMGAGLGGGSSDAAAVLLALPVLAGRQLPVSTLCTIGQQLGSDVPFFLLGGTAAAIGRGTEAFPLADIPPRPGLIVAPGVHVSTVDAYRALSPRLTTESQENKIFSFLTHTWGVADGAAAVNDFEPVVFERESRLATLKQRLIRAGASPAMLTGSGSALFGLFRDREAMRRALERFRDEKAFPISLITRAQYRRMWRRALEPHLNPERSVWPPQSRYKR
jgi:4-diphosphocytidyl-2-C-methyl-D-erythritol kinase